MFGRKNDWRGFEVRDRLTKLAGIAQSKAIYLNGSVQYAIQPPCAVDDKGTPTNVLPDAFFIDEQMIEKLGVGVSEHRSAVAPHKIVLGKTYKDEASGVKGIATCIIEHVNGCASVQIQPKGDKEHKAPDVIILDWKRLKLVDDGVSKTAPKDDTGGPMVRASAMAAR
jgi:hypothetical protein